jgi:hypothetical protein
VQWPVEFGRAEADVSIAFVRGHGVKDDRSGITVVILAPGLLVSSTVAPSSAARSRIADMPTPAINGSRNPRPSWSIVIRTSSAANAILTWHR